MPLLAASSASFPVAAPAQVDVPAFRLPSSDQLSPKAMAIVRRTVTETAPLTIAGDVPRQRAFYTAFNDARLEAIDRLFWTGRQRTTIGRVLVAVVEPAGGIGSR